MLAHCERGDEYVTGQEAHTFKYEGGGAAVLGSIQPQPVDFEPDGSLDLDRVAAVLKPPDDDHFARTRLLCLENTARASAAARLPRAGPGLHARAWPGTAPRRRPGVQCGSEARRAGARDHPPRRHRFLLPLQGLGAPVGSLLCGPAELVRKARRWRKVLGGGMRQAGVIAAAGQVALEQNVGRLAVDHANAARLAEGLMEAGGFAIDADTVQTNMVFARVEPERLRPFVDFMHERGVAVSERNPLRLVTHLDVSAEDIEHVIEAAREFFARNVH